MDDLYLNVKRGTPMIMLMVGVPFFFVAFSACKPKQKLVTSGYVIGVNNIIAADGKSGKRPPQNALQGTVLIAVNQGEKGTKFCSGSLIEGEAADKPLRVLTNHHCFALQNEKGLATENLIADVCAKIAIYAGFFAKTDNDVSSSGCTAGSLKTSFDLDLGLFTLSKPLPNQYKPLKISSDDALPSMRSAFVVHYPDIATMHGTPSGTRVTLPAASVTLDDCQIVGPFNGDDWTIDRAVPYALRHTCDIQHGSSGSPLIDAQSMEILGVNWGGVEVTIEGGQKRQDNAATAARFVRAFLQNDAVVLNDRLSSQPPSEEAEQRPKSNSIAERLPGGRGASCGFIGIQSASGSWFMFVLFVGIPCMPIATRRMITRSKRLY